MPSCSTNIAEKICINSLNCRGLAEGRKRRAIFQWIKTYHPGITLLQETHSTLSCEQTWKSEWGGNIYFCHGTNVARGVAILCPKNLNYSCESLTDNDTGRFIALKIKLDAVEILLCNVYLPTKDRPNEQKTFVKNLFDFVENHQQHNIVIGGDFNICLNPYLDKSGGDSEVKSANATLIENYCDEYNLIDIWRTLYPDVKRFTWRGNTKCGIIQSRLDYWLISRHMTYDLDSVDVKPSIKSDHSIISVSFKIRNTQLRGKNFWKFNKSLLRDKSYVERINKCLIEYKDKYNNVHDKSLAWDSIKCELRSETISYSCYKSKEKKKFEQSLKSRMEYLETKTALGDTSFIYELNTT